MKRFGIALLTVCLLFVTLPATAFAAGLQVPAKSALLMEVSTGQVLFEQDAAAALPPASVTKVMTMLLIMEAIDDGRIGWEDPVTASAAAAAKGGSQVYLKEGEVMRVREMVKSIAVSSANDCACAMAEHLAGSEEAFVQQMNEKAQALGMENTHFVNCTGLDDDPAAKDHLTSAKDIALMSRELLGKHPAITDYTTIWMDTIRDGTFGLSNTNKLVRFYNGATGLKTGFTAAAGYCLSASAQRDGMELVAVVMGCESSKARFAACKQLLDQGFASYALVCPQLEAPVSVPVKLGCQESVGAAVSQGENLLIDKSQKSQITQKVELLPEVTAPVSQGQHLGELTVLAGEQVLAKVPLVAEAAVEKLSWWQLFRNVLKDIVS